LSPHSPPEDLFIPQTVRVLSRLNRAYRRAQNLGVLYKLPEATNSMARCILYWRRKNPRLAFKARRILQSIENAIEVLDRLAKDALSKAMQTISKGLSGRGRYAQSLYWKIKNGEMAKPIMIELYMGLGRHRHHHSIPGPQQVWM